MDFGGGYGCVCGNGGRKEKADHRGRKENGVTGKKREERRRKDKKEKSHPHKARLGHSQDQAGSNYSGGVDGVAFGASNGYSLKIKLWLLPLL